MGIIRSQGLERLVNTVEAHRPLVDAIRGHDPARIRAEFGKGATSAYGPFLEGGQERAVLAAFGLVNPVRK